MNIIVTPGNFMHFTLTAGKQIEFFAQGFGQTLVSDATQNTCVKGLYTCSEDQSFTAFNCSPQPMVIKTHDVSSTI